MDLGNEKWIPVAKAAEKTGYSDRYLRLLCKEKRIKCIRLGRDWFTTLEAVRSFKKSAKVGRPEKQP